MDGLALNIYQLASIGYCCTQIMLKLVLMQEAKENPDLIKAANGLCGGIGFSGKTCGVLTGGICIFGLYAGKGSDSEYSKENFDKMIKEYTEWFEEEFESTECVDIVGYKLLVDESGERSYPTKCGDVIEKGFIKAWELLEEYGYELGEREE